MHQPVDALTEIDGGYAVNPRAAPSNSASCSKPTSTKKASLAGIINCWPLDICADDSRTDRPSRNATSSASSRSFISSKRSQTTTRIEPRLYLVTANAQPALGTEALAVDQAAVWGLGRVIGHQEFADHWGGLIDIDDADDRAETAARICEHILADEPEDQIAIRGRRDIRPAPSPVQRA